MTSTTTQQAERRGERVRGVQARAHAALVALVTSGAGVESEEGRALMLTLRRCGELLVALGLQEGTTL
jgi:hypothetical protein